MLNFNKITFGNENNVDSIEQNDLKAGLRREDFSFSGSSQSIFDVLDKDKNMILEDNEIQIVYKTLQESAAEDGDATSLTEQESKNLLQKLGLSNINPKDLFQMLSISKEISSQIDYSKRNEKNPDEIIVAYKPNVNGTTFIDTLNASNGNLKTTQTNYVDGESTITVYNDDGSSTETFSDGEIRYYNAEGICTGGKLANSLKTYKKTNNPDGGYTITFSDDKVEIFDKDGRWIGGITSDGREYQNEYDADGNRIWKCGGETTIFDKDDNRISTTDSKGNICTVITNKNLDGTKTETYSDGREYNYDEKGRLISGKYQNGTTFTYEYDKDGNYTRKNNNGEEIYYSYNEKLLGGKIGEENITYTRIYGQNDKYDNYRYDEYVKPDGSKIYKGANGKVAHRSAKGALCLKKFAHYGESFSSVMNKLGIKSSADKIAFKKANPIAAEAGKFSIDQLDVIIPKSLEGKINLTSILGDKVNDKKPAMGL